MESGENEDYFNKPLVQEKIKLAYAGFEKRPKGVGFCQQHQRNLALNYFAFAFLKMNQAMDNNATARKIFEEIGGNHGIRPWSNTHPVPGLGYMEYRNRAFKGK